MQGEEIYDLVIVGGGPAGATAAIYSARAALKTAVLDKGLTTGALGITSKIANYPGIDGEIGGAELLAIMRKQAASFGAEFIDDKAIGADFSGEIKQVYGNQGVYPAKAVIIATGSMGRSNLIKGEAEFLGRGVSYCAICDAAFFKDAPIAVTGNSDEAVEEALYLTRFASKVTLLSPTPELRAPEELIAELAEKPNAEILKGAVVREILGEGQVQGIRYLMRAQKDRDMPVNGVFVYLQGGVPVTDWLQGQLEITEAGCIRVNREYETSVPGIFAVGDVLCSHIKQAVIAASDGAIAAIAVEKRLRGKKQMGFDWSK
jgi:thioredoxin reductase (NADPH)